ncbi:MAG: hypothetical protein EXQ70_09480 [Solirubrobacterales bacterium]|nr:hypothetical protein [Solirubrobacterales bacterium]
MEAEPRNTDEWRVEVNLDDERHGLSLGERLHSLRLDDEARKRLGGSVIVTRDGPQLFLYSWHEQSAREADRVIRELMEQDGLAGEVKLMRWHPVEEDWRPATDPLPITEAEQEAEHARNEQMEADEAGSRGGFDWEVVVELADLKGTQEFAKRLEREGLEVKRRWKYLLVGALTEELAIELGKKIEAEAPEGSHVGIRANPEGLPLPAFVMLGSMKPGVVRDLGI